VCFHCLYKRAAGGRKLGHRQKISALFKQDHLFCYPATFRFTSGLAQERLRRQAINQTTVSYLSVLTDFSSFLDTLISLFFFSADGKESPGSRGQTSNRDRLTMTPGFDTNGEDSSRDEDEGDQPQNSSALAKETLCKDVKPTTSVIQACARVQDAKEVQETSTIAARNNAEAATSSASFSSADKVCSCMSCLVRDFFVLSQKDKCFPLFVHMSQLNNLWPCLVKSHSLRYCRQKSI